MIILIIIRLKKKSRIYENKNLWLPPIVYSIYIKININNKRERVPKLPSM